MNFQQAGEHIQKRLAQALRELPQELGNEAVNFSLERFKDQAWLDKTPEAWQPRKDPNNTRSLLVNTGKGRRSVRILRIDRHKVFVGAGDTDSLYMVVHNFGGDIEQNVKPHARKVKGKIQLVRAFTRTLKMPRRQFF